MEGATGRSIRLTGDVVRVRRKRPTETEEIEIKRKTAEKEQELEEDHILYQRDGDCQSEPPNQRLRHDFRR